MSKLAALQALAALAVATGPNMTEAVAGGARTLPEGYAFARLVEYVEFGNQPQEFEGKARPPAPEVQLGFALWGEGYQNDDGSPYILRPYPFAISQNAKSKAFKTFKTLNWTGTCTHFAQLLGQAYLLKIVHKKSADGKVRSVADLDQTLPPLDPVTKQPYPIPAAADDLYRLFLWEHPTIEAWDALYIDGVWEAKDGKPAESKNRLQETLLSALDFDGSALDLMLRAAGRTVAAPAKAPAAPVVPSPAAPQGVAAPALPQPPVAPEGAAVGNALSAAAASVAAGPTWPGATGTASPSVGTAGTTTSPSEGAPALPPLPTLPAIPA